MTNFLFWVIWTAVCASGIQYSFNELFNRDITYITAVIAILTYQWIILIKPVNNKKALPPPPTIKKTK